jgi:hypothetical protein
MGTLRWSWIAHPAGWLVYLALTLAADLVLSGRSSLSWSLRYATTEAILGCTISSGLWWLYAHVRLPKRATLLAAGALAMTIAGALVWFVLESLLAEPPLGELLGLEVTSFTSLEVWTKDTFDYCVILLAWHGGALALRGLRRAAEAERLAQEARLAALRYQLNPHFLFNTLNSAIALTYEDVGRARRVLTLLGNLLRDTLKRDETTSTVGDELAVIERYVEIERLCHEGKLRVDIGASDGARGCRVPPLLLHGLVENAIKHGMRSSPMPLHVELQADYDGRALRVEVVNSGALGGRTEGTGLKNLRGRLDALYAGRHRFSLAERDGRVRATIEIDDPEVSA